jgi:hypothetical protein
MSCLFVCFLFIRYIPVQKEKANKEDDLFFRTIAVSQQEIISSLESSTSSIADCALDLMMDEI